LSIILKSLPALKTRVVTLIEDKTKELERYGPKTSDNDSSSSLIMKIIQSYVKGYNDLIEGKAAHSIEETDELKGGARINRVFNDVFEQSVKEIPPINSIPIEEICYLMHNQRGLNIPLYTPHQAFESLVRRQLELLKQPAIKVINLVSNEILSIHANVTFPELERYPAMKDAIRNIVEDLVNNCVEPASKFVNDVLDNEIIFINTARHDFRGAAVIAEKKLKDLIPTKKTHQEEINEQALRLRSLADRYYELCCTQIVDVIPKAIIMMLVEGSSKNLNEKLIESIFVSGLARDILKEDPQITKARERCEKSLEALNTASHILADVSKFHI